jgi:hypothetical protein
MEMIKDNPHFKWVWYGIFQNPNITIEFIKANLDKDWDWYCISQNPNIDMEIIKDNPNLNWNWSSVSLNPNIDMEIIKANPNFKWNWENISLNDFIKDKEIIKRKYIACLKIQKAFRKYRYDPKFPFCKRVLINNLKECGVKI